MADLPTATSSTASPSASRTSKKSRWLRLPRKLKITREGKYFIGITFGVGFAAINTGNNLLYLLLGMLLSLIVVSSVMSEMSLRELTVSRRLPPRAQVHRPHLVEIEVHNHKQKLPSYAIEVEDLRKGQPADKRCFFLKIGAGSAQVAAYRRVPARRGKDCHVGFRIATRFPFGLFEKSREFKSEGDLVIYPPVDQVQLATRQEHASANLGYGQVTRGFGDDILTIRAMRDGDDVRDIYWRKSTLHTVVRERARETDTNVSLSLDYAVPPGGPSKAWSNVFEQKVRDVASRAVAHIKRGDAVSITAVGLERARGDKVVGTDPILRYLALVNPADLVGTPREATDAQARTPIKTADLGAVTPQQRQQQA